MTILDITGRINKHKDGEPQISPLNDISITWSLSEGVVGILVKQPVMLCTSITPYYWTIKYPDDGGIDENAPPSMSPMQRQQLLDRSTNLKEVWDKEKEVLDTLLKMWCDPTHLDRVSSNRNKATDGTYIYGSVIQYKYPIGDTTDDTAADTTHLTAFIELQLTYSNSKGKETYQAVAEVYLNGTEAEYEHIPLTSITLPIVEGIINPVLLLKYLSDNPLIDLVAKMKGISERLSNKYLHLLYPDA